MKVPEDIQEAIKNLGKAVDVPVKNLVAELKEIIETDEEIQAMEKDSFKIRVAWAKLYRRHTVSGNESEFYVMPALYPSPVEITTKKGEKMWLCEFSAMVQKISKDDDGKTVVEDPVYGAGTFFRDGAKGLQGLEKGKVYKASLIFEETDNGYAISSDRASFSEAKHEMPMTFNEFFEKEIESQNREITLGDMDLNKSKKPTDIRVVTVTAFDYDIGKSGTGKEFGYYDFMDNSIMGSNFRMFFHPKDIDWEKGSLLKVGIRIDFDSNNELRTSPHFIIPTDMSEKRELNIKPVGAPKEVDTSEPEDEPEQEEKEEPKEEPKKESKDEDEDVSFEI